MSLLDSLFGQIAGTIQDHASPNTPGPSYDANPLLGTIASIFSNHAGQIGQSFDPGSFGGQNVRPASEDPYGDPADQGQGLPANVRPASEDPYGDPADQR